MASRRILLVEDDEAARFIIATVLRHAGYAVTETRTAVEGLRSLETARPDAVLVDVGLPDVDGFELIRRVRASPVGQALPIVVVTVYAFDSDRESAFAAGCDRFLTKPISPAELLRTLEELLPKAPDTTTMAPPASE
ncbi:MAG TPA: response regulator [Longimicrobiaceae bacterium]